MYYHYIKKDYIDKSDKRYIEKLTSVKSEVNHKKPRKILENQNINLIKELQASEPETPVLNKIKGVLTK